MAQDHGVYDQMAEAAIEALEADAVALIVVNGKHGSGMAVVAASDITLKIPKLLRDLAGQVEQRQLKMTPPSSPGKDN